MKIGDMVVRRSHGKDITFKIIDMKIDENDKEIYILKGVNIRIEADSPAEDLEVVTDEDEGEMDRVFNRRINASIKKVISQREDMNKTKEVFLPRKKHKEREVKKSKDIKKGEDKELDENLIFGRPGRILHVDGDPHYLEVCLKTYKELSLEAIGKAIPEKDQPGAIVNLVKEIKPDIVVITGHDGVIKDAGDFMDLNNYRNSKHFVQAVANLRNHNPNYDDLVIFAGACQSCYEAILDAGANLSKLRFFGQVWKQGVYFFLDSLLPIKSITNS